MRSISDNPSTSKPNRFIENLLSALDLLFSPLAFPVAVLALRVSVLIDKPKFDRTPIKTLSSKTIITPAAKQFQPFVKSPLIVQYKF
jgi:hypothetical protein